ncbi:MAG: PEP-CTERM sorting domain-containing protein [Verrucomicrobiota bacterium JB023]|nr:PEP-CTERM sorting domain-containing protein [Verrucomicrobiota bacterium JB023]
MKLANRLFFLSLALSCSAQAATIFQASSTNTTNFSNNFSGGTTASNIAVTDSGSGVILTNDGPNFFAGGFTSTDTISTLLGAPLSDTDKVTLTFTVSSVSSVSSVSGSGELRSRGIELGLVSASALDGGATGNLILGFSGAANGSKYELMNSIDTYSINNFVSQSTASDGFSVTISADVNGYTISATDALLNNGAAPPDISNTFEPGEFTAVFGSGLLYFSAQQRNGGVDVAISEASIEVTSIPEPSVAALLGLGLLAVSRRRR